MHSGSLQGFTTQCKMKVSKHYGEKLPINAILYAVKQKTKLQTHYNLNRLRIISDQQNDKA
ncbi:hypothetical protein HA50_25890 [Pantoea cypripedii]|uniref:Uncharacterized protein n=1 Tax=Pantoea cypripedii TaxID=55209 RepID=A0A1X1EMG7_PANCY|nr:hypothetical protein HA50_25890 [Pantoea cypripedii]